MSRGFLGNDASLMLDLVVCALVLIVPILVWSVWQARYHGRYTLHRNLQIALAAVLFVAVGLFEIDLQVYHGGWQNVVNRPGEPPRLTGEALELTRRVLRIHLVFAISTPILWGATIGLALRRFPSPPAPGAHSRAHRWLGWISAIDLALTAATGLAFYYVAFVV